LDVTELTHDPYGRPMSRPVVTHRIFLSTNIEFVAEGCR